MPLMYTESIMGSCNCSTCPHRLQRSLLKAISPQVTNGKIHSLSSVYSYTQQLNYCLSSLNVQITVTVFSVQKSFFELLPLCHGSASKRKDGVQYLED